MAYYFSHDSNARNDDKILALRMKHGWEGYGLYWALIERMREAATYACVCDYNVVAYDLRTDAAKIKSIIEDFGLFSFEADESGRKWVYSESLRRRMRAADEASENRSEAARKAIITRWEREGKYGRNTDVIRTKYDRNTDEYEENKIKINNIISSTSSTPARARKKPDGNPSGNPTSSPVEASENFSKKIEAAAEIENGAFSRDELRGAVNYPAASRNAGKAEENAQKCLESAAWVESVCIQNGITPERVAEEIRLFPSHLEASGYDELKTLGDFKRHFMAYLRKKLRAEQDTNQPNGNQHGNRNKTQADNGGGDAWSDYRSRHGLA